MFVLCPHCQFLVAVDPGSGLPPARCPRCDGNVVAEPGASVDNDPPPASLQDPADVAPEVVAPSDDQLLEQSGEETPLAASGDATAGVPADAVDAAEAAEAAADDGLPAGIVPALAARPRKLAPSFVRAQATSGHPSTVRNR